MGSRISISLELTGGKAEDLLREARGWFRSWETTLSRFNPESELSRLNAAGGHPFHAGRVLWSVLRLALRAARETGGLVTPCALAALEAAGYTATYEHIDRNRAADTSPPPVPDWRGVETDVATHTVKLPPGARLDLGGFGKGWAAERCAMRLGRLAPVLVDAGGDIAATGPRQDGLPWHIDIPHPLQGRNSLAVLPLLRGGVATSGRTLRRWRLDGEERHHLIDPRTGRPAATDLLSVTVLAERLTAAEAAAKAIFLLGSRAGWDWLEGRPSLAAIMVRDDGAALFSPTLSPYSHPAG